VPYDAAIMIARPQFWRFVVMAASLACAWFAANWLLEITDHPLGSDLAIYRDAAIAAADGGDPYHPFAIGTSFVNHPFLLSIITVAGDTTVWLSLGVLAWLLATDQILRLARPPAGGLATRPQIAVALLAFAPAWETTVVGQVNHLAMLCLVMTLALDLRGCDWLAGCCLAVAIVLKTSPVVFLVWYLLLGRWRVVAGAGAALLVMTAVASIQFGGGVLVSWLDVLPRIGGMIRGSKYNQSILALAYRQLEPLGWSGLVPTLLALHKLGFVAILGIVLHASWRQRRATAVDHAWLFATLLTVIVVSSPLVWYHHSVFLTLAIVMLLGAADARTHWLAFAALALIQVDRVFEHVVTRHAWPVLAAHGILLVVLLRKLPRRVAR
jgi:alpha-1,2-mannosyltransferase